MQVWGEHKVIAEYPADHRAEFVGHTLMIRNARGAVIRRFAAGEWSAVHDDPPPGYCAYFEPDPGCQTCHPGQPEMSP